MVLSELSSRAKPNLLVGEYNSDKDSQVTLKMGYRKGKSMRRNRDWYRSYLEADTEVTFSVLLNICGVACIMALTLLAMAGG